MVFKIEIHGSYTKQLSKIEAAHVIEVVVDTVYLCEVWRGVFKYLNYHFPEVFDIHSPDPF